MPLTPRTVRFTPEAAELLDRAADLLGISTSQFIREGAIVRALIITGNEHARHVGRAITDLRTDPKVQELASARLPRPVG